MKLRNALAGAVVGLLLPVAAAPAGAATVTVRIEGKAGTIVPETRVTLPTAVFDPPQQTEDCQPDSYGGALKASVGEDWFASSSTFGYFLERIRTEDYALGSGPDGWSIWRNGRSDFNPLCASSLGEGDEVLFFVDRCTFNGTSCEEPPTRPLVLTAPERPVPGQPFSVKVEQLVGDGTKVPAEGVTVSGGDAPATTGADGTAQVTVQAGERTLLAEKPFGVRDRAALCATTGSDGRCGTFVPPSQQPTAGSSGGPCLTTGVDGFCGSPDTFAGFGRIGSVEHRKVYARGKGPRLLSGTVERESQLKSVSLRLTGRDGDRCRQFSGTQERLVTMRRCGAARGTFFEVGTSPEWSFLLPERLPRGRWVLDVRVEDRAGNVNKRPDNGRTRAIFTVR
jgi:hypothetical protein